MSTQTGKWETVVSKKKGHVTKADVKKAQKKFIDGESAPKIQPRGTHLSHFYSWKEATVCVAG